MLNIPIRVSALVLIVLAALLTNPTFSTQENNLEAYELKVSDLHTQKIVISAQVQARADNRADRLRRFLSLVGSPMAAEAGDLVKIADRYDLDWTFLPAIAGVESTYGRFVPAGSHNAFGWHNGNFYFNSWTAASEYVAKGIKEKWGYLGKTTPWKIGPYYAENPNWAARVQLNIAVIRNFK